MKKRIMLVVLCLVLCVAGIVNAEDLPTELTLNGFTVVRRDVSIDGQRIKIELTAEYTEINSVGEYVIFGVPTNEEGRWYSTEELIKHYNDYNGLGHLNNIYYMVLKTLDGEPFIDYTRDWECGGNPNRERLDGSHYRVLDFDGYSLHTNDKGVIIEFHLLCEETPYNGEPQATMFVEF